MRACAVRRGGFAVLGGEGGVHGVINLCLVLHISSRVVCMVAREVLEILEVGGGESISCHPCFQVGRGGLELEGFVEVSLDNDQPVLEPGRVDHFLGDVEQVLLRGEALYPQWLGGLLLVASNTGVEGARRW